jgi:Paf1
MASSSSQRMIHQDYIARIRYSNALPPPPNPPKLLDIPNTGLASGQYTTPGFASRLARDQPLNIEADAELGMPLDLVGMPGIFDGDESCKSCPSPVQAQTLTFKFQLSKLHYMRRNLILTTAPSLDLYLPWASQSFQIQESLFCDVQNTFHLTHPNHDSSPPRQGP